MKITMVVPSYWRRKKDEGWKSSDTVYDHPTPLDEEGTLGRFLESLSILENKDFNLVILGVANALDIQDAVEDKLGSLIKNTESEVRTILFSGQDRDATGSGGPGPGSTFRWTVDGSGR